MKELFNSNDDMMTSNIEIPMCRVVRKFRFVKKKKKKKKKNTTSRERILWKHVGVKTCQNWYFNSRIYLLQHDLHVWGKIHYDYTFCMCHIVNIKDDVRSWWPFWSCHMILFSINIIYIYIDISRVKDLLRKKICQLSGY